MGNLILLKEDIQNTYIDYILRDVPDFDNDINYIPFKIKIKENLKRLSGGLGISINRFVVEDFIRVDFEITEINNEIDIINEYLFGSDSLSLEDINELSLRIDVLDSTLNYRIDVLDSTLNYRIDVLESSISDSTAGGDMFKIIYDTNNNGIVDNSEALDGQAGSYYKNRINHDGSQSQSTITNLIIDLDNKVAKNSSISSGVNKTKISYDSKGLVTDGTNATTADINDTINRRYVNDSQLIIINNTDGTNSGDQNLSIFELELTQKIGNNSYMEYVLTGDNITQVNYWTNSGKTIKLFTKNITYSGSNPTTIVLTDEITGIILTTTIAYSGDTVLNVTKIIT